MSANRSTGSRSCHQIIPVSPGVLRTVIVILQGINEPKTTLGGGLKPLASGGGIFKSAAVAVLRLERKLMTTGDITKCVF